MIGEIISDLLDEKVAGLTPQSSRSGSESSSSNAQSMWVFGVDGRFKSIAAARVRSTKASRSVFALDFGRRWGGVSLTGTGFGGAGGGRLWVGVVMGLATATASASAFASTSAAASLIFFCLPAFDRFFRLFDRAEGGPLSTGFTEFVTIGGPAGRELCLGGGLERVAALSELAVDIVGTEAVLTDGDSAVRASACRGVDSGFESRVAPPPRPPPRPPRGTLFPPRPRPRPRVTGNADPCSLDLAHREDDTVGPWAGGTVEAMSNSTKLELL